MLHAARIHPPRALVAAALLLAALVVSLASGERAQAAQKRCSATFHVLHNDRIGELRLPAGHYEITLLNDRKLTCQRASSLFAQFLEDYDGKLPRRWRVIVSRSEFRRGNTDEGFRVRRVTSPSGGGGGGRHPANGRICPGSFRVLHNDRIGQLRLPRGNYRITLLSVGRLSCQQASRHFTRFLEDWDGKLPGRWRLDVQTATFSKGRHVGFRVKRLGGGGGGGGGGVHPGPGQRRCPGTFRVLHNDRIGPLRLPRGNYTITLIKKNHITCRKASRKFAEFLQRPGGRLPGRWIVQPQRGTFRRGPNGLGFRVKLVSRG